jgi:hypothetical protein
VKGEENVAIEAVIGLGHSWTRTDSIFGFLHYVQSASETDVVGDDDDAKDIRALSPGLLYRRSLGAPASPIYGTLGLTAYPTFDFAQDSEILRGRLFLSDIAFNAPSGPICNITQRAGPFYWNCRVSVFAEYAYVLDAGRSTDLATLDDDQYFGLGSEAGLTLSLFRVPALAPLQLSVDYRYMGIVSGTLDDPHRLTVSLSYKIPASNISISLSHIRGDNFETFQPERLTKFAIGFRY